MSYQIADEPHETAWRRFVVHPTGPLLAVLVCGAWLAIPWFAANAIAMGSPTRRRELALCGAHLAGATLLAAIVLALVDHDVIDSPTVIRVCLLGIVTYKLATAYAIQLVQLRAFEVYTFYDGPVRSGLAVVVTGYALRPYVLDLSHDRLWRIIVSGAWG